MTDVVELLSGAITLEGLGRFVRWFVLGVFIAFAYYVVYSLRRLRRNLHFIANVLTAFMGEVDQRKKADATSRAGTPPRRPR